jgi:hypothetical protein
MLPLPFLMLFLVCFGLLAGSVEGLRRGWFGSTLAALVEPEVKPVQKVEAVAIAVPPRPKGVRPVQGEGEGEYRYTEEGCEKLKGEYRDICMHQLARQRADTDLDGGLAACRKVEATLAQEECTADVAELYSRFDRAKALAVCPTIPTPKWRDQCVFGIALAAVDTDPDGAFTLCAQAGMWHDFCRHDVNGEIAQVDTPKAWAHCAADEGDLLRRKTCWHGMGKYIARVDVDKAFATCAEVPLGEQDLYRENCFHGLGWGASETAGVAFAEQCGRAGEKADSCLVGVAYNLRRFDSVSALSVCEKVQRADLHDQCERFVRNGRI